MYKRSSVNPTWCTNLITDIMLICTRDLGENTKPLTNGSKYVIAICVSKECSWTAVTRGFTAQGP